MIAFLTLCYLAVIAILVRLRIVPNKPIVWASTLIWSVFLLVVLFIPMQWGAPSGPVRNLTYAVPIIPNVAGQVTEVAVEANTPISEGDLLFKIDDTPYRAAVDALKARLAFQKQRLEQFTTLETRQAGTRFQVEETQALVNQLEAELAGAQWQLDSTVIRAPAVGYVTNLALRKGQRVISTPFQPAMVFIDTSETTVVAQIQQIHIRHVKVGQSADMAFKTVPGRVFSGVVEAIIDVTAQGQATLGTTVPAAQPVVQAEPFFVRIKLNDQVESHQLPPGTVGTAAIYTEAVKPVHLIRKVMIRMEAILNYILPTL